MRDDFYSGYHFVTNIKKNRLLHSRVCLELAGVENYLICEDAYDNYGNKRDDLYAIVVKDKESQDMSLHRFFQYSELLSCRMEDILKRNGILPSAYMPWKDGYEIVLGSDMELCPDADLVYYRKEASL